MSLSARLRNSILVVTLTASGLLLCLPVRQAAAQAADQITFQGYLEEDGSPVSGAFPLTFRIYEEASGGTPIWEETHPGIAVTDGVFAAYLGSVSSLGDLPFGESLFVSVAMGDGQQPAIGERIPLSAVPYALAVRGLRVTPETESTSPNVVAGWSGNKISDAIQGATISGGGDPLDGNGVPSPNGVFEDYATVGGGLGNLIGGRQGTIGGGEWNQVRGFAGTVGGGKLNTADGDLSTIAGGDKNEAQAVNSSIVGGTGNVAGGSYSSVVGGIRNVAVGLASSIAGGRENTAGGTQAHVGGGLRNSAGGHYATIPGGSDNSAGGWYSFAAGSKARVRNAAETGNSFGDRGTFVWSDFDDGGQFFESTGRNQFLVRARGGIGFNTNAPRGTLSIARAAEAAEYQVEIRNESSIHGTRYDGVVFTQGSEGGTQLGAIQLHYHSNGYPDLSLNLRQFGKEEAQPRLMIDNGGDVEITGKSAMLLLGGTNGGGGESIGYRDTGGSVRPALHFPGRNIVALSNQAANGTVEIRANTPTGGVGGEAVVAQFRDDRIILNERVGIGVSSPSVELDVDGAIRAAGFDLSSDRRLKRDITTITDAGAVLDLLRGVTYHWRPDAYPDRAFEADLQYGLIAQEVRDVLPDMVSVDAEGMLSVSYLQFIPLLIESLKQERRTTEALRNSVLDLQAQIDRMADQVATR